MTDNAETFGLVQPFPFAWVGEDAERARLSAIAEWHRRLAAEGGTALGEPTTERLDPAVIDGAPLTFAAVDEETGEQVETPPMSAWQVIGPARQ